jgi:CheY-like chemotaxis protein
MAAPKTILVVDNDPDLRDAVREVITHAGYHFIEAASGEESIELATRVVPDLILMDIYMPGIGGLEAAERIRDHGPTRRVPIVALTGELLGDQARARHAGEVFHSILWKPMTPTKLMLHIRGVIGDP